VAGSGARATPETIPDDVRALLDERAAARATRDFATADRVREELAARGFGVTDGPDGQTIARR
jgi:cysteinyl-tRNA synthetase